MHTKAKISIIDDARNSECVNKSKQIAAYTNQSIIHRIIDDDLLSSSICSNVSIDSDTAGKATRN